MARFGRRKGSPVLAKLDAAAAQVDAREVGGKAQGLARAMRHGLAVPTTWVLGASAFRDATRAVLPPGHDPQTLISLIQRPLGVERAAHARSLLLTAPLDDAVMAGLEALWDEESGAPWGLAVRSSASPESEAVASMAGLCRSILGVRSLEELADAVREVWASAVSPDALLYLRARREKNIAMAVVIQPVVVARAAGALSTRERTMDAGGPVRVVSAAFGLGAPVVGGTCLADTFRLLPDGSVLDRVIVEKKEQLVVGERGVEVVAIDPVRWFESSLSDDALAEIAEVSRRLDLMDGGPWHAEIVVSRRGGLRIVQLRPSIDVAYPAGGDATTVWSRSVLGEALSGVLTPLSWSVFEDFSERAFLRAFSSLGATPAKGARLVGRVHGRFYTNVSELVRAASEVPGLDTEALVDFTGREARASFSFDRPRSRAALARIPLTAARLLVEQRRLAENVKRHGREADQFHRWLAEIDIGILPDDGLKTTLREVRDFYEKTGMLAVGCAMASLVAHVALRTLIARHVPGSDAERLAQAITAGAGELDTARPSIAIAHVVAISRREPEARDLITSGARTVDELPIGPTRRAIEHFLGAWGYAGLREAELSAPRWAEDPGSLLDSIAAGLAANPVDVDGRLARVRAAADRDLAELEAEISYPEVLLVRALVTRVRRFNRLREQLKMWVARELAMMRRVVRDVDRRLLRIDPGLPEGAAFFCTYEELVVAVDRGRDDLGAIVRARRAEYARDCARPDPPETFVGAPPPAEYAPLSSRILEGAPASGGAATGPARLVTERSARVAAGEILVSRTTDVALVPAFLVAAGVVTEIGSPLSHAALLAREFGVPAVVGVHGATRRIRSGDLLRIDGDRGTVEITR